MKIEEKDIEKALAGYVTKEKQKKKSRRKKRK